MIRGSQRYVRAYLAGVAFPTVFLAVILVVFVCLQLKGIVSNSASAFLIFPMALVPNVWGIWNMAYVALSKRREFDVGLFGAVLPALIAPLMFATSQFLGHPPHDLRWPTVVSAVMVGVIIYYLLWKHLVGYLNRILDLE
ncbi:MAG TPA: hypothetical protein VLL54_09930 [Pyrinomonadaceae bacterium]|nr:hypothetical protein [Pyrinomonadaceae bacterium]